MTPNKLAALLTPEQMRTMDHAALFLAREHADPEQQGLIAPYEHRAFAREATEENPLMALPIAAGTLMYQPAKALLGMSRSPPAWDQVGQGLLGVGEGLRNKLAGLLR